ncbi:MAG: cyclophilin-like family protein [Nitrososphaera sp.]
MLTIELPELDDRIMIELCNSLSPRTVQVIIDNLPIRLTLNRWGDELYSDETPIKVGEENGRSAVDLLDVAFWPEGSAICLFYGYTPLSRQGKIIPYSNVNVVGRITSKPDDIRGFLNSIEQTYVKPKAPLVVR